MSDRLDLSHTLTVVPGIEVGHAADDEALTGVTVVLCRAGGVASVELRGGAVGGRQLSALDPHHVVDRVHGFVLCGGSAFGLAAADGVMQTLADEGIGFDVGGPRVPILPTAVIFDLKLGAADVWPDAAMGARAVAQASGEPVVEGCVGAGLGASVGKLFGPDCATKGGLGSAGLRTDDGLCVGALAVVNAFGDIRDPASGELVAGARNGADSRELVDALSLIRGGTFTDRLAGGSKGGEAGGEGSQNTTLGVVTTNAKLDALEMKLVARLAADAFASCLSPGSTRYDGDLVFAITTGEVDSEPHRVGLLARAALEASILRGVQHATPLGGLPAARDLG